MNRAWYVYTRSGSTLLPENYIYCACKPTCNAGRIVCAIYAIYAGLNPAIISTNLQVYISAGQATGLAQPTAPLGTKKFVYLLPS